MSAQTWAPVPDGSAYTIHNLPYGVFSTPDEPARVGVRIGDHVLDLAPVAAGDTMDGAQVFARATLDGILALGPRGWKAVRSWVTEVLTQTSYEDLASGHLVPIAEVTMHAPFTVADYVDFYSSEHHAANVGKMFRPDAEPLLPNWKHLPVGYHGRAGTVVPSGTPIIRPSGQRKGPADEVPVFGPTQRLDIEAEVGFVVGVPSEQGTAVPCSEFQDHVFGVVLVNDWSARDIQAWEYVPLGPFLGKSFATSISNWVTPLEALQHAKVAPPERTHPLLPYLEETEGANNGLDIAIQVHWNGTLVSSPPFETMYWTPAQQLAHMTVNGASLRTGDLYASGTVSGPEKDQRGSFLELSWAGKEPITLGDGSTRTFLQDGDTVTITATAPGPDGTRIALGEVTGTIQPARG